MAKTIIFDFDGTLADTLTAGIAIYNSIATEYGCLKVPQEKIEDLRSKRPQEFLADFGVTFFKLPKILLRMRDELNTKMRTIEEIPGIVQQIINIHNAGYSLGVLTSNSQDNVKSFLQRYHVDKLFNFIFSEKHIFGKHKAIKRLLKKNKLSTSDVIYVADETRDIEAAHKAGIKIISVSWGFNTKNILEALKPDTLIHKPSELISAIQLLA